MQHVEAVRDSFLARIEYSLPSLLLPPPRFSHSLTLMNLSPEPIGRDRMQYILWDNKCSIRSHADDAIYPSATTGKLNSNSSKSVSLKHFANFISVGRFVLRRRGSGVASVCKGLQGEGPLVNETKRLISFCKVPTLTFFFHSCVCARARPRVCFLLASFRKRGRIFFQHSLPTTPATTPTPPQKKSRPGRLAIDQLLL